MLYLASVVLGHKDVPSSKVSVYESFAGQVVHAQGHLLGVASEKLVGTAQK